MILKYSIITAIFAVCLGNIQAQHIESLFNGHWDGILTQDPGGVAAKYPFKMTIKVMADNKIVGRSYANIYDNPNFVNFDFVGTIFQDELLTFQEAKIAESTTMDNFVWCIKGGQLKLIVKKDKLLLVGYWQGTTADHSPCIPGKIYLEKSLIP